MAIDNAEKRKSISGLPFLIVGVTPNISQPIQWRRESAWSYCFSTLLRIVKINDIDVDLLLAGY
jgi:hypothetical protein